MQVSLLPLNRRVRPSDMRNWGGCDPYSRQWQQVAAGDSTGGTVACTTVSANGNSAMWAAHHVPDSPKLPLLMRSGSAAAF